MDDLVTWLERFNRKERFALVAHALGETSFRLDPSFIGELVDVCKTPALDLDRAQGWMDYHLDWLYAALIAAENPNDFGPFRSPEFEATDGVVLNVNSNQEDIDLLVAVPSDAGLHLFLVEAKWQSPWSTQQMASKIRKLVHIFGADGQRYARVFPHLVLISTAKPTKLAGRLQAKAGAGKPIAPGWMLADGPFPFPWVELKVPADRATIQRTDSAGKPSKTGESWILKYEQTSG